MNNDARWAAVKDGAAAFAADGRYTTTAYIHPRSHSQRIQSMSICVELDDKTAKVRLGCTWSDNTGMTFSVLHLPAWVERSDRDAFTEILTSVPGVSIQE